MRPAGLTHDQAMACLKDQSKADAMVAIGKRATDEIKMTGTPTFVIDGKVYGGELSIDQLKAILDPYASRSRMRSIASRRTALTRRESDVRPARRRPCR